MKKLLTATQVKDGWVVIICEHHKVHDYTEVERLIRYNGLRNDDSPFNEVYIRPSSCKSDSSSSTECATK